MKGHVFTREDFGKNRLAALQRRRLTPEQIDAHITDWCARETERYKIVATDGKTKIIAEELEQRVLNKMSPEARAIAGMMLRRPAAVRSEVLSAFDKDGSLKIPFSRT